MAHDETAGARQPGVSTSEHSLTSRTDAPAFLSNANATAIAIALPIATLFGLVLIAGLIWFILRRRARRRALAKAKEEQAKGFELRDVAQVRVRAGGTGRAVWDGEEAGGKAGGSAV
ncbi:hypothetical protein D7B24_003267 [Verticillium nonalfalfae]|uniref:Uncharacterized protein n=1 Tax=Verticillium nonalfalfae TaxID=1051616 RepID=A0A3M9YFJ6_9PEZI|nr:uncharacterized protein D7B24_003267 [Verticillium nonalfalfae]RNJ59174.1 hypothetical protein D7B24_003267 [Verticillium nonalfalfae]